MTRNAFALRSMWLEVGVPLALCPMLPEPAMSASNQLQAPRSSPLSRQGLVLAFSQKGSALARARPESDMLPAGMNYLHSCKPPIVHRDLKSPNLLVDKDLTVKVIKCQPPLWCAQRVSCLRLPCAWATDFGPAQMVLATQQLCQHSLRQSLEGFARVTCLQTAQRSF